jgi:hypothetical protein
MPVVDYYRQHGKVVEVRDPTVFSGSLLMFTGRLIPLR